MPTAGDKFWIWGQEAGCHDSYFIPKTSRMTPVEGAFYLNIHNMCLVDSHGKPKAPFDQYAVPLRPLKRVVWSLVGAGGRIDPLGQQAALDIAAKTRNITGFVLDDFFKNGEGLNPANVAHLSMEQIKDIKKKIKAIGRKLDLWVVFYAHQLNQPVQGHLNLCDKVTFWTWRAEELSNLEKNFTVVEKLAPKAGKLLGCYMYDYGTKTKMPVNLMKMQCELGLRWLKEGRIEGMIFCSNCCADIDLEAVEWTRNWIAEVGPKKI